MTIDKTIHVTSHVARDLLASAAAFKTESAAIWEYVVNSLQYVELGRYPIVNVRISNKEKIVEISDNGRGMDVAELSHYFEMHGENTDRLNGQSGRGKFGTGKSAAFGIGNCLLVDTTKNGIRNVVMLTRSDIENSDGSQIPVKQLVRDEPSSESNGTRVVVSEIFLNTIRSAPVIEYIERSLQAFRGASPRVAVNSHLCEYRDPEVVEEFEFTPSTVQMKSIGEVTLKLSVAREPLDESFLGVAITAGVGNLVARESCGIERKSYGQSIFGEIDVPMIESSDAPMEPYDSSRSLKLNPAHPVAATLIGFIGSKLEQVRKGIADREKAAQDNEQARRLKKEADKIAEILNQDFNRMKERLNTVQGGSSRKGSISAQHGTKADGGVDLTDWAAGFQELGDISKTQSIAGQGKGRGKDSPDIASRGELNPEGLDSVDPVGGKGKNVKRPTGGFSVEYRHLGESAERSKTESGTLTIVINRDHKVVATALRTSGEEDPKFRRLSYEIAFSEYAISLGYELVKQDPGMPPDDVLYEVKASLNRVSSSAAHLYE